MTTETQTTTQNDTDVAAGDSGAAATSEEQSSLDSQTTTETKTSTESNGDTTTDDTTAEGEGEGEGGESTADAVQYEDFSLPEGYQLDETAHADFVEVAKGLELSQEAAQALIDYDAKRTAAMTEKAQAEWSDTVEGWKTQLQNDEVMGKGKYEQSMATANKAIDTFGTPELRTFLDESGLGNHPELLKAFYKAGAAISEDRLVSGEGGEKPDFAKTLYKNSNMN